jgi:hypothetical protein
MQAVALLAAVVLPAAAPSGGGPGACAFGPHSYSGTSLGGRPVVPPDNQSQCCEICRSLPGCQAGGLDPKAGRCYPVANITGWSVDRRYVGCVPPPRGGAAAATFSFASDTLELLFAADTLALKNVTVTQGGVRLGLYSVVTLEKQLLNMIGNLV